MGLLRRLADRFEPETRSVDPSWQALAEYQGTTTSPRLAENLSTVLACVQAISASLGSLPAYVYVRTEAGRQVDGSHPLMRLIREGVNPRQTWPDFVEWLMASVLLRGNGLAEIVPDNAGRLSQLWPIPWDVVNVELLNNGRLAFEIHDERGRRRLLRHEVLHVADRSDDGIIGRSRLHRARSVIATSLQVQDFAESMFGNQAAPSGVVEADGKLSDEALKALKQRFKESYEGTGNARKTMVLDQGVRFKAISVSPEDAELLASRKFGVEEIARIFGCPPPIIGDLSHSTFTNSETAGRWFAQHTLTPWLRKLEAEIVRSVFTERSRTSREFTFDLSGFLRGDPEQRWQSHQIAVNSRILTANEVREVEGYGPRDDGDSLNDADG